MIMKRIAIIGGGACGLWCAQSLIRYRPDADITVFERFASVGKKIAMSGNSRGNLTNLKVDPQAYNAPSFVAPTLNKVDGAKLMELFIERGVLVRADEEGRVYPMSESAQAVVDVMKHDLVLRGVKIRYENNVTGIDIDGQRYLIKDEPFDYVVLATGTKAGLSPHLPVISLPTIAGKDRFEVSKLVPALCAIGVDEDIRMLQGLRVKAAMELISASGSTKTWGELQIIEKALSGIAIFELSSLIAREKAAGRFETAAIMIDFLPDLTYEEIASYLEHHSEGADIDAAILEGLLAPRLSQWLLLRNQTENPGKTRIRDVAILIKKCRFRVNGAYEPKSNQVYSGGIRLEQIDPETLEARDCHNLFIGGEMLDVDGLCGGYNLHFAFASGEVIAQTIAAREKKI
jgi:hypothetical protein